MKRSLSFVLSRFLFSFITERLIIDVIFKRCVPTLLFHSAMGKGDFFFFFFYTSCVRREFTCKLYTYVFKSESLESTFFRSTWQTDAKSKSEKETDQ